MAKKSKKQRANQRQPEARPESAIRLRAQPDPGAGPQPQPWVTPADVPSAEEVIGEAPAVEAPAVEAPVVEAPAVEASSAEEVAPEHRASERVAVSVDIHLASESHFFSGLSGDISEGGLFLSTYRPLRVGSEVDLEFSLPGADEALHARGEVRWLREHSVHEPRGVGIAFAGLSEHDRERIHRFCTVRPPLYYEDVG